MGQNSKAGVGVLGYTPLGYGVVGWTSRGTAGVWGSNIAEKAVGKHGAGAGVWGSNEASDGGYGVIGSNVSHVGAGVLGIGDSSPGVKGISGYDHGIIGSASRYDTCGVVGMNAAGIGVGGKSMTGYGVVGASSSLDGVFGVSTGPGFFAGVVGVSVHGIGVSAQALDPKSNAVGLYARAPKVAAVFKGDVLVKGNLSVDSGYRLTVVTPGNKNGVVAFADGSQRLVCAIESPEAWFEDFGEASLVKGKAHVALDPHFAQTIDARRYHVFLTAYGETAGLYVARRTRGGFDIAERKPGKSRVRFSWRVVARPKATKHKRFAKTTTPQTLERIHAAIDRDNRRRSIDVAVLKTDDLDMRAPRLPRLLKGTKPKLPKPPKLPNPPKRAS